MENLKQEIKKLSSEQPIYKNQRKTVHIIGERTMEPWQAIMNHSNNRHKLRLLYAVQGILKGKTLAEIETKNKPNKQPLSYYQNSLDKLIKQYEEVVCVSE